MYHVAPAISNPVAKIPFSVFISALLRLMRLEENHDYLSVLLNYSTEGIISVDTTWAIKQINQAAKHILKTAPFESISDYIGDFFPQYKNQEALCGVS